MLADLKPIFGKVLVILIIVLVYYLITKYNNENRNEINNTFEAFENNINKNKTDYLKLKETYIEPQDTSLELLYTNYSGEELNKDTWEDKTLDQCIDTCNKMNNCIGFSRDSVLDTEPSKCYPRTIIDKCHSNRKGNYKQMSNAIKYNSYIKSNTPDIVNKCIGDTELTLNRNIHIKSYLMPNTYIGNIGDGRVSMVDIKTSSFKQNCNFRLEKGKEGVGSVSFLHIDTNQYLYRDNNNMLIFKNINNTKTEDRQRVSFNIIDGLSNGIILKVIPIEGETTDKYIMIDEPYLNISTINDDNITKKNKYTKNATFYIVDNIINTQIIDNKNKISNTTRPTPIHTPIHTTRPTSISTNSPIPTPINSRRPTPTPINSPRPIPTSTNSTRPIPTSTNSPRPIPTSTNSTRPIPTSTNSPRPIPTSTNSTRPIPTSTNSTRSTSTPTSTNSPRPIPTYTNNSINEGFVNELDTTNNIDFYNQLFNPNDKINLSNYLEDNYLQSEYNSNITHINKKMNESVLTKSLSNSISKNEEEYKKINDLNKEIEKEINNKNINLDAKNDKIINNLDKMKIKDLANDYFFLKTISLNQ